MKDFARRIAVLVVLTTSFGCQNAIKEAATKNAEAIWNDGKTELIDEQYTPEAAKIEKAAYAEVKAEYASWKITVDQMAFDGDSAASVWTFTGIHKATGKSVTSVGTTFVKLEGRKISKLWRHYDTLKERTQVGYTLVAPGAAAAAVAPADAAAGAPAAGASAP